MPSLFDPEKHRRHGAALAATRRKRPALADEQATLIRRLEALRRLARVRSAPEGQAEPGADVIALLVDGLLQTTNATRVHQVSLRSTRTVVYDAAGTSASASADRLSESAWREAIGAGEAIAHAVSRGDGENLLVPLVTPSGAVEVFLVETTANTQLAETDIELATVLRDQAHAALSLRDACSTARLDALTGCLNRGALIEQLEKDLTRAQRRRSRLSCLMLDVDNLKAVNDVKGHQAGDHLIRLVAGALLSQCRPYDSCARYGGDEFLLILPDTGMVDAVRAAERIRETISMTASSDPQIDFSLTLTVGVVEWRDGDQADDLIRRADEALLRAKAEGKNRVRAAQ